MFPKRRVALRQFVAALILFFAAIGCYGQVVIAPGPWWPPPPPPPAAPVSVPGPFTLNEGSSIVIHFNATNSAGNPVTYTASALNGTVTIAGTDMTYAPNTNAFVSVDTISFNAYDTVTYRTFSSHVSITFVPTPGPPVMVFAISPLTNFPGATNPVILCASNGQPVSINVDGSATYDPDLLPVSLCWYEGTNCFLTNAASGSLWESSGIHTIVACATDNTFTNSASETLEVITPGTAATYLQNFVDQSVAPKNLRQHLHSMLFKASVWLNVGKEKRAYIELSDFERRLQARHDPLDPALTTELENATQEILDQLPPPGK